MKQQGLEVGVDSLFDGASSSSETKIKRRIEGQYLRKGEVRGVSGYIVHVVTSRMYRSGPELRRPRCDFAATMFDSQELTGPRTVTNACPRPKAFEGQSFPYQSKRLQASRSVFLVCSFLNVLI
jgi:hypothetical protein